MSDDASGDLEAAPRRTRVARSGPAGVSAWGCLTLILVASSAHAGALDGTNDSYFLGDRAALMGGAVVAIPGGPESAWYNPAGLGAMAGSSISVSASAFMLRDRHVSKLLTHDLSVGEPKYADLDSTELFIETSAIVMVWKLMDDLSITLGFFTPRSDSIMADNVLSLQATDEDGLTAEFHDQLSDAFRLKQIQAGPAIGWQLLDWLAIGMGLNLTYGTVSADQTMVWQERRTDQDDEVAVISTSADLAHFAQTSLGLQASLGLQFSFGHGLHLGVLFRPPVMQLWSATETSTVESSAYANTEPLLDSTFDEPEDAVSGFSHAWASPVRVHLGLAYEVDFGWFTLEGDVAVPVAEDEFGLQTEIVWNVKGGATFSVTEDLQLGVGLFTDRSMAGEVSYLHDARVDFYGITFGGRYDSVYDLASEEPEGEQLVVSSTIAVRYAAGIGQYGAEWHNPDAVEWVSERRDVLFHELSLHVGSGLSF